MSSAGSHPFGYGQSANNSLGMGAPSLQQTPRSLSGQQFPSRSGGNGVQGHVTPTSSGMPNFSPCLPNNMPPQQPSPNSRSMLMNSRPLPTQRSLSQDMKRIVGLGGPLGGNIPTSDDSFNKRERSSMFNVGVSSIAAMASRTGFSQNSRGFPLQGLMNNSMQPNNFSTSPALDLSEFPSLTNRSTQENSNANMSHNPMAGRPPYVGMVKQPTNESNEFQIHSEDFPALPGSQTQDNNQENVNKTTSGRCLESSKDSNHFSNDKSSNPSQKRGIQTSKDGRVTNIPPGMVTDQFGMVGLLTFIRAAESDPKLVSLALGSDLTTLGLNLNTTENLYPSFGGPWAEHPCRPQDIDYHVPSEYLVNQNIRDKLAPVKLNRYGEDLLFYLFYMFSGDVLQIAAAAELYNRDWRFHKDERVWITRVPGMNPTEKSPTYERGMYYFFDADNWRKVAKEFHLDYDRLEERPIVPPAVSTLASSQTVMT
ncbi:CCR4-NOT transcription complex subunit 2-like isoform X2 [Stegodyphus dumicola]|uniref:CCR4-NOT transcription complex subunit 2-like isoform X2 n=1 Tax=Stegodyphus dumicola TaxID=202533 RepID=UPI0015B31798|nr:CCR4-NOT transcription complex subunit 2-like isoform X2 [Stegodyphus dumicola]